MLFFQGRCSFSSSNLRNVLRTPLNSSRDMFLSLSILSSSCMAKASSSTTRSLVLYPVVFAYCAIRSAAFLLMHTSSLTRFGSGLFSFIMLSPPRFLFW